jgi:hypothetical protein
VNTESIDDAKMEDGKNGRLERIKYTGINERKFSDFSSQFSDKENGQQSEGLPRLPLNIR